MNNPLTAILNACAFNTGLLSCQTRRPIDPATRAFLRGERSANRAIVRACWPHLDRTMRNALRLELRTGWTTARRHLLSSPSTSTSPSKAV